MIINPYIHFNDSKCRDAMNFYKDCFGGELFLQTVGESGMADKMPGGAEVSKDKIMHSSLTKDGQQILLASDMMDPSTFKIGDNVTVSINFTDEAEIRDVFAKLSAGGKVDMELHEEFWGALFGMLTDKYGIDWMLNLDKPKA